MAAAATLAACAAPAARGVGRVPATPTAQPRWEWHTHSGESGTRRYRLFVPAGHRGAEAAPLVVMLHGCTQDPDDFARATRFNQLAADHGTLVAYPEQTTEHNPQKCWSWYDPAHQGRGAGEPAILAGITREVMARHGVDPRQVFVVGISAGGAMAATLAAAYPDVYAAAAVHSGVPYRSAAGVAQGLAVMRAGASDTAALRSAAGEALRAGGRLPALFVIHGEVDPVVSPVNARQLVEQWAAALALFGPRVDVDPMNGRSVTFTWWEDAAGGRPVALMSVAGLGHAWSGGSPEGSFADPAGPDAGRELLRFLLANPMQP